MDTALREPDETKLAEIASTLTTEELYKLCYKVAQQVADYSSCPFEAAELGDFLYEKLRQKCHAVPPEKYKRWLWVVGRRWMKKTLGKYKSRCSMDDEDAQQRYGLNNLPNAAPDPLQELEDGARQVAYSELWPRIEQEVTQAQWELIRQMIKHPGTQREQAKALGKSQSAISKDLSKIRATLAHSQRFQEFYESFWGKRK